ncbi:MAG: aldolase/citrate lyase family protein, partial [Gemmatimonadota bacterium]
RFPDRAIQRRNAVLELMRRQDLLSDADASVAKAFPLRLARASRTSGDVAPYFVEWVRRELTQRFGRRTYEQGLRVITTLDLDLQGAAERALEKQLRAIEAGSFGTFPHPTYEQYLARAAIGEAETDRADSPYLQGAFVALDPRTGGVRALVGGRDFDDSKFDRATGALRQPGSTFKPIVYATAVQAGRGADYMLDDAPIEVPQLDGSMWSPKNFDNTYEGPMSMRQALAVSRNVPAVRLAMELGEGSVVEMAKRFGITTPVPPYPSIALGSADVYPLEMIASYSVFANLGWRVPPTPILRVPWNEFGIIGRMLDAGALGIVVPMVNSVEEARAATAACRYAPDGARSYGPVRASLVHGAAYYEAANREIACIPMIETRQAVERIDDILAVPGIDAVYVGPADLSITYGLPPAVDNPGTVFDEALDTIVAACRVRGITPGIHSVAGLAGKRVDGGFGMVTITSDLGNLTGSYR